MGPGCRLMTPVNLYLEDLPDDVPVGLSSCTSVVVVIVDFVSLTSLSADSAISG